MQAKSMAEELWGRLSSRERELLAPKLIRDPAEAGLDPGSGLAGETFVACLCDLYSEQPESDDEINARLLTVRNFLTQIRAYDESLIWREIERFCGFRRSYLELTVYDRERLLDALRSDGYWIGREPPWSIHRFDSARAVTRHAGEPSLHFANDRADEQGYGPNYFFVHWDATSVVFREVEGWLRFLPGGRSIQRLKAALRHRSGFAEPADVQHYLIKEEGRSQQFSV